MLKYITVGWPFTRMNACCQLSLGDRINRPILPPFLFVFFVSPVLVLSDTRVLGHSNLHCPVSNVAQARQPRGQPADGLQRGGVLVLTIVLAQVYLVNAAYLRQMTERLQRGAHVTVSLYDVEVRIRADRPGCCTHML